MHGVPSRRDHFFAVPSRRDHFFAVPSRRVHFSRSRRDHLSHRSRQVARCPRHLSWAPGHQCLVAGCRGSFPPLSENGSPSPPGIQFSSPPGRDPHRTDFCPSSPPCQTASARNKRTDNRQRDSPARTATVPLRAARRLSPACRKNRPVPTPSFYGRVNNFEAFSGRRGPACRLFGDGETTTLRAQTRPPAFFPQRELLTRWTVSRFRTPGALSNNRRGPTTSAAHPASTATLTPRLASSARVA
jgi:hypothetical protein